MRILLCILIFASCSKKSPTLTREQLIEIESKETLLPNQIWEKEALRFTLAYNVGDTISLQHPKLRPHESKANIFVLYNDSMPENSSIVLKVAFDGVKVGGMFDVTVEGFTNINTTKKFTLSANSYSAADKGKQVDFIKIQKGFYKYTFSKMSY